MSMSHKFSIHVLCIMAYFFMGSIIYAQEIVYNGYGLSEGLMSQTVYCAMQSRDGYLWFGTDAGVSRFDGHSFENFTSDDGLCDTEVLRINQDSKGRIWFLSLSGCLAYYYQGVITSAINNPDLRTEIQTLGTSCFAEDSSGSVWFSGMDIRVVRFHEGKVSQYEFNGNSLAGIRSNIYMFQDANGKLLLQDHAQIGFLNEEGNFETIPNTLRRPLQNCFSNNESGTFALVDNGLYNVRSDAMVDIPDLSTFPDLTQAIGLSVYEGRIWIPSGELGVYHWIKSDGKWVFEKKYFENEWVNYVLEDEEGNTWFCTRDHGINCILPQRKNQFYIDLAKDYQATSFARHNEKILFGTGSGEIYSIDTGNHYALELYCNLTSAGGIEDLLLDEVNNLFVRTATKAFVFPSGKSEPIELTNMRPKVLYDDGKGRLYLSMLSGISFLDKQKLLNPVLERLSEIPAGRIYNVCDDDHGRLWFEKHDKLFYLKNEVVSEAVDFNRVSRGRISSVVKTNQGDILVSTMGSGVYFMKGDEILQSMSRENGLPSNECEWVRVFGNTAFLLTSVGLVSLDIQGQTLALKHHYGVTDGMPDARIYDVLEQDGVLYLATHRGLFFLPSENSRQNAVAPIVHITDVWCNGVRQASGEVQIPYGENLKMDFTAIAFDMPDAVMFQYTFSSNGDSWTSTSNRSIEISSLDWGEHFFQIRAKKYDSDWSEPIVMRIYVLPPVWATWWFRVGLAVGLAGAVYGLFVFLARRKYKKKLRVLEQEQALLRERNRISTDLHDDIGAELSNIVILSRIARSRVNSNDNPSDYIAKIDISANDVISKMNGIIWSLNPSNDNLQNLVDYIRRYVQDFFELCDLSGKVVVTGEVDKSEVKALVRRNTFLIVKEALHNIRKHADATEVDVAMRIHSNFMLIEIEDNGKGFDENHTRPDGLGLGSMRRRAQDMGGNLDIKTSLNGGTKIILKIPK